MELYLYVLFAYIYYVTIWLKIISTVFENYLYNWHNNLIAFKENILRYIKVAENAAEFYENWCNLGINVT